jgi:hypothetical protein
MMPTHLADPTFVSLMSGLTGIPYRPEPTVLTRYAIYWSFTKRPETRYRETVDLYRAPTEEWAAQYIARTCGAVGETTSADIEIHGIRARELPEA